MRLRESVRALILDPDDCVLLVRFDWDGLDVEGGFWAIPGGGVEAGETRLAALRRELAKRPASSSTGWPRGVDQDGAVPHDRMERPG